MKKWILIIAWLTSLLAGMTGHAQPPRTLSLEECLAKARNHYPMIRQLELVTKAADYNVSNAGKANLPQLVINGQATYQSEVTQLPLSLPGQEIPVLDKDQYRIYGEVTQKLYDGGAVKTQTASAEAQANIDRQQTEVELYQLVERIQQIYFGVLLMDGQLAQTALRERDLQLGLSRTEASIANGTALRSSADVLKAELLTLHQRAVEWQSARKSYLSMLGVFMNETLEETVALEKPATIALAAEVTRPELKLYDYQEEALNIENESVSVGLKPKLNLFVQGGYGRPALNLLSNDFTAYYIGGVRLSWNLGSLYTTKNSRQLIALQRQSLGLQRETFLFNTNIALQQERQEVEKYRQLLATDDEIIALRTQIKNTAAAQLANSVITANDYLREVNAEDLARQDKILHEIQWLEAQYHQQFTTGK